MKLQLFIVLLLLTFVVYAQNSDWVAPASASSVKNPITNSQETVKEVKKFYLQQCALCHGEKGKGDGFAGVALQPRPANFVTDKFQNQTDGAIYWKLTYGRAPMAAYETIMTDEQRWKMVHFLRSLGEL